MLEHTSIHYVACIYLFTVVPRTSTEASSPYKNQGLAVTGEEDFRWGACITAGNPLSKRLLQTQSARCQSQTLCGTLPWRRRPGSWHGSRSQRRQGRLPLHPWRPSLLNLERIKGGGDYQRGPRGGGTSSAPKPLRQMVAPPSSTFKTYYKRKQRKKFAVLGSVMAGWVWRWPYFSCGCWPFGNHEKYQTLQCPRWT